MRAADDDDDDAAKDFPDGNYLVGGYQNNQQNVSHIRG